MYYLIMLVGVLITTMAQGYITSKLNYHNTSNNNYKQRKTVFFKCFIHTII